MRNLPNTEGMHPRITALVARYWRSVHARPEGAIVHHADCGVYGMETGGQCTCGLIHDLQLVLIVPDCKDWVDANVPEQVWTVGNGWRERVAVHQDSGPPLVFTYRNHRGDVAVRRVRPHCLWYGYTQWHVKPQWLLKAYDLDRKAVRDFPLHKLKVHAAGIMLTSDAGFDRLHQVVDHLAAHTDQADFSRLCGVRLLDHKLTVVARPLPNSPDPLSEGDPLIRESLAIWQRLTGQDSVGAEEPPPTETSGVGDAEPQVDVPPVQ